MTIVCDTCGRSTTILDPGAECGYDLSTGEACTGTFRDAAAPSVVQSPGEKTATDGAIAPLDFKGIDPKKIPQHLSNSNEHYTPSEINVWKLLDACRADGNNIGGTSVVFAYEALSRDVTDALTMVRKSARAAVVAEIVAFTSENHFEFADQVSAAIKKKWSGR